MPPIPSEAGKKFSVIDIPERQLVIRVRKLGKKVSGSI
jgi:hypothetical protein